LHNLQLHAPPFNIYSNHLFTIRLDICLNFNTYSFNVYLKTIEQTNALIQNIKEIKLVLRKKEKKERGRLLLIQSCKYMKRNVKITSHYKR